MKISKKDFQETRRVSEIIQKVDKMDANYMNSESDKIYIRQPLLISTIMGYHMDLKSQESEDVARIIFMIWEYYKDNEKIIDKAITELQFDEAHERNISFLNYMESEVAEKAKSEIIASDFDHLDSKALLTGVFFRFNTQKALIEMEEETRGIVMIGMKSLIECMEENGKD